MWRTDSLEKTDAGKEWRQEEKGTNRGWDGWMASPTRWTWVWESFGSWWRTGKAGKLQSMVLQRVRYYWATELNWTEHSPAHQSKTWFFHHQSLPSANLYKSLSLIQQRADRSKNHHNPAAARNKTTLQKTNQDEQVKGFAQDLWRDKIKSQKINQMKWR